MGSDLGPNFIRQQKLPLAIKERVKRIFDEHGDCRVIQAENWERLMASTVCEIYSKTCV